MTLAAFAKKFRFPAPEQWSTAQHLAVFLIVILPIVLFGFFSLTRTYREITREIYATHHTLAHLSAAMLEDRFDRLIRLGTEFESHAEFRDMIASGRWEDAITHLKDIPAIFPEIERIVITDAAGTLLVDRPALPDVRGKNFAFRDWYRGVSASGRPYVSPVYRRTAQPQYPVVGVALPLTGRAEKAAGYLLLQLRADTFLTWTKTIQEADPRDLAIYFADSQGNAVAHPQFSSREAIVNFSDVTAVRDALAGRDGVAELFNPVTKTDELVAYVPVTAYGWAALVSQNARAAFVVREEAMRAQLLVFGLAQLMALIGAYLMIQLVRSYGERERELGERSLSLEKEVYDRTQDLREKISTLERLNRTMVDRELAMVGLKKEIQELKSVSINPKQKMKKHA